MKFSTFTTFHVIEKPGESGRKWAESCERLFTEILTRLLKCMPRPFKPDYTQPNDACGVLHNKLPTLKLFFKSLIT